MFATGSLAVGSPVPGTKTITITRGGRTYQRTVLDPIEIDGRLVRQGSVIVRFRPGVSPAA